MRSRQIRLTPCNFFIGNSQTLYYFSKTETYYDKKKPEKKLRNTCNLKKRGESAQGLLSPSNFVFLLQFYCFPIPPTFPTTYLPHNFRIDASPNDILQLICCFTTREVSIESYYTCHFFVNNFFEIDCCRKCSSQSLLFCKSLYRSA